MKGKKFLAAIAGAAFALAGVGQTQAASISNLIVANGGGLVKFDDRSVETLLFSADGDTNLGNGDILGGFAHIEALEVGGNSIALGGTHSSLYVTFQATVTSTTALGGGFTAYEFGESDMKFYEFADGTEFDLLNDSAATLNDVLTGIPSGDLLMDLGDGDQWNAVANSTDLTADGLFVSFDADMDIEVQNFGSGFEFENVPGPTGTDVNLVRVLGNAFAGDPNNGNAADFPVENNADMFIYVNTIPEPMTAGLGLLSLGALALRRRRQA